MNRVAERIESLKAELEILKQERNDLIKQEFRKNHNIETYHKIKTEWIYWTLSREFNLSKSMIKKIILFDL